MCTRHSGYTVFKVFRKVDFEVSETRWISVAPTGELQGTEVIAEESRM